MEYSKEEIQEYAYFLISDFAKRFSITVEEASHYFNRYGAFELINQHYGIMHTLTFEDGLEGVISYCARNGGEYH